MFYTIVNKILKNRIDPLKERFYIFLIGSILYIFAHWKLFSDKYVFKFKSLIYLVMAFDFGLMSYLNYNSNETNLIQTNYDQIIKKISTKQFNDTEKKTNEQCENTQDKLNKTSNNPLPNPTSKSLNIPFTVPNQSPGDQLPSSTPQAVPNRSHGILLVDEMLSPPNNQSPANQLPGDQLPGDQLPSNQSHNLETKKLSNSLNESLDELLAGSNGKAKVFEPIASKANNNMKRPNSSDTEQDTEIPQYIN